MRILLDESVPARLGSLLAGHTAVTVQRRGWGGVRNGKLLALAAGEFDVLLTADKSMEHQQNLATLPVAVLVVLARSNRLDDLAPGCAGHAGCPRRHPAAHVAQGRRRCRAFAVASQSPNMLSYVAFVDRSQARRIISLRRAERREVKRYVEDF